MFSRRTVLAASVAAPIFAQARQSAADDTFAACRGNLAALFPNSLHEARALGRLCGGEGLDANALLDRLCDAAIDRRQLADAPLDELRALIDARIRADYAQGRTRRVEGWVLSRTETWLYAILAG